MKFNKIIETATKTFALVKLGGKKNDQQLAELDRGVLTIALLVAAMDGTVTSEEYTAFLSLAKKCRGASAKNVRTLLDAALPTVGQLMTMAQVGVYTEEERLVAFLAASKQALPGGLVDGSMADMRRAFALWVTMALADGEFSAIERSAIRVLLRRMTLVRTKKARKSAPKNYRLLEKDFLEKAERIARDLATPSKRTKAEADLRELIALVPTTDDTGKPQLMPARGIAMRLAMMATLGFASADPVPDDEQEL